MFQSPSMLAPAELNGTMMVSSSMIAPLTRDPLAFIDAGGHVLPHEAGRELFPGVTYLFTRQEVASAISAHAARQAEAVARVTASPLPNLHQGGEGKPDLSQVELAKSLDASRRGSAQLIAQFLDPAGKAVRMPGT